MRLKIEHVKGDPIFNYFDCPACGVKYAGLENFGELFAGDIIECSECGAKFRHLSEGSPYSEGADWWPVGHASCIKL